MILRIKPFDVIERRELPEITTDRFPVDGDPLEINMEMYFVCEINKQQDDGSWKIGVIPLVIRNPNKVQTIEKYLESLSVALRRMQNPENIPS